MADLSYLFQGNAPPAVNSTTVAQNGLPEWYQEYLRGIAAQGVNIAGQNSTNPIPQMSVADFSPEQLAAFQAVQQNRGAWQPAMQQAGNILAGQPGASSGLINQAQQAVAGPTPSGPENFSQYTPFTTAGINELGTPGSLPENFSAYSPFATAGLDELKAPAAFPDRFSQYMSPYTMGVVNEISRLGTQNFSENIMPAVTSAMIGSGQFGSTRNADLLGRAARDTQRNITGAQSEALQAGYGMAGNLFNQDAAREQQQQQARASLLQTGTGQAGQLFGQDAARLQQQQQARAGLLQTGAAQAGNLFNLDATRAQQQGQLQSSAALQGAQIGANAGVATAGALTNLGQNQSALGLADAQAIGAVGQQKQGLQQGMLDTAYTNQVNAQGYDWSQLNNLNSIVRGMQLPQTQTQVTNAPLSGSTYTNSPLAQVGQVYGWMQGARK